MELKKKATKKAVKKEVLVEKKAAVSDDDRFETVLVPIGGGLKQEVKVRVK